MLIRETFFQNWMCVNGLVRPVRANEEGELPCKSWWCKLGFSWKQTDLTSVNLSYSLNCWKMSLRTLIVPPSPHPGTQLDRKQFRMFYWTEEVFWMRRKTWNDGMIHNLYVDLNNVDLGRLTCCETAQQNWEQTLKSDLSLSSLSNLSSMIIN